MGVTVELGLKLKTGKAFTQFVGGYGVTAVAFAFAACADSVSLQKHFNDAMKTLYAAIAVLSFFTDGLSTTHNAGIMSSTHTNDLPSHSRRPCVKTNRGSPRRYRLFFVAHMTTFPAKPFMPGIKNNKLSSIAVILMMVRFCVNKLLRPNKR